MKPIRCVALALLILSGGSIGLAIPVRKPATDDGRLSAVNSINMKFVRIPAGAFIMGSPPEEKAVHGWETQHKVTLTRDFFMSVHLVTQDQWQAVMGNNPSHFKAGEDLPVENVSWDQCQQFAKRLREKEGKPYRLPTDAEWEYACRAGTTTAYYFGKTLSTEQANFNGVGALVDSKTVNRKMTTPIGSFPPNPWGLYDMHGNLWQWCQDRHGEFSDEAVTDPTAPTRLGGGHVMRGGCWSMDAFNCRSSARGAGAQDCGFPFCGFRLCYFAK